MSVETENPTDYRKGNLTDNPLSIPPGYPSSAPPGYPSSTPTGYPISYPTHMLAENPAAFPNVTYTSVPQVLTTETPRILPRRSCPVIGFGILQILISITGIICAVSFQDARVVYAFSEHVLLTHVCFLLEAMLTIHGGCHYKKRTEVLYISFIVGLLGMFLAIVAFATTLVFVYGNPSRGLAVFGAFVAFILVPLNVTCAIILSALQCCKVCRCCVCYRFCTE